MSKILFLVAILLLPSLLLARECPTPDKLDDILSCLKKNHYLVQLQGLDILRTEKLADALGQRPNPAIGIQAVTGGEGRQTQVIIMQDLDLTGRLKNLRRQGKIMSDLSLVKKEMTQNEIVENVLLHIHHLIHINETLIVNREVLESLKSVTKALKKRPVLNPEQEASLLNFNLQQAEVRNLIALQEDEEEEALLFFHLNGGYSKKEILKAMEDHHHPLELLPVPDSSSLTLERLALKTKIAANDLELQKNRVWEGVSVGPMYLDDKRADGSEQMFGLALTIPLPLWHQNEGGKALAEVALANSLREFDLYKRKEGIEKVSVQGRIAKLKASLDTLPPGKELTAAHKKAEKLYAQGLISSTTYLDSHRIWRDVVSSKLELEEKILLLTIQYYRLIGKLNEVHL